MIIRKFGIAVDVIDGTTLAAKGLNGAYSIAAGAKGLKKFTDMQAYTYGGPVEILEKIDFTNKPEEEVVKFVNLLKQYFGKNYNELNIVTHSPDTGKHHNEIIAIMRKMGVNVIVPEPVIVEPPYIVSLAMESQNIDGMIGVFGLPEVVINSILCKCINSKKELYFKIASNKMLSIPDNSNLGMMFDFSEKEKNELNLLKLDIEKVYKTEDIVSTMNNACFVATALTDDSILHFKGLKEKSGIIQLETLYTEYNKNVVKIITKSTFNP